jgi:hypothetical protein
MLLALEAGRHRAILCQKLPHGMHEERKDAMMLRLMLLLKEFMLSHNYSCRLRRQETFLHCTVLTGLPLPVNFILITG